MPSKEDYAQWIVQNQDKAGTPEFETVAAAYKAASDGGSSYLDRVKEQFTPQRMAGSQLARAATGFATPLVGALQIGAQIGDVAAEAMGYPGDTAEKIGDAFSAWTAYQRGGMQNPDAIDFENIAGQAATLGGVTSKLPQALTVAGKALQGVAEGAGAAMLQPATSDSIGAERLTQAVAGGVVGGAVPLLGAAGRAGIDRLTQSGIERSAGRLANEAAGPRRDAIIQALRANQNPLAQGTAGEVAAPVGSAEFSALQRRVARSADPSGFAAVDRAQNEARVQALRSIGQTPDDIVRAQTARSAATQPLYQAAETSEALADPRRTITLIDNILQRRSREPAFAPLKQVMDSLYEAYPAQARAKDSWNSVRAAISSAGTSAPKELVSARQILNQVKNFEIDEFTGIARLQALKPKDAAASMAIREAIKNMEIPGRVVTQSVPNLISASRAVKQLMDQKGPTGAPVNEAIVRELSAIKRSLDAQIAKVAPEYGQANRMFRDLSKPIDQMKVGQFLEEKLTPALSEQGASAVAQRPSVFAQALRDASSTVRGATGFRRAGEIKDIMSPQQMDLINRVGQDLARRADFESLARAGTPKINEMIGDQYSKQVAPMLSRVMMMLNNVMKRTAAGAGERGMAVLAEKMKDPVAMADLMQKATEPERRVIQQLIQNAIAAEAGESVSGGYGAMQSMMERM